MVHSSQVSSSQIERFQKAALGFYRSQARDLPWRKTRDPYRILVSEIMLQQTQVDRVIPKYRLFLKRFPSLRSLARARFADVLRVWIGLGYNGRALRLWRCAQDVVRNHGAALPRTPEQLALLPGIGSYTAAAVAAFAFDAHVVVVDTNVRRVVSRVLAGRDTIAAARLSVLATAALPTAAASSWAQALMDIGARFCKAVPRCSHCPLAGACDYRKEKMPTRSQTKRVRQAYAGSRRFYRGRIMRMLSSKGALSHAVLAREVNSRFGISDRAWLNDILKGLARDGLVRITSRSVRLP